MKIKKGVGTRRTAQAVSGTFRNFGGPVVKNPNVISIYWGPSWGDGAHIARRASLDQFLKDLLQSSLMSLLAQYGVGPGTFQESLSDPKVVGTLTDASLRFQLQSYFNSGLLAEPDGNRVHMIFFDENVEENDPGQGLVLCEPSGDTAFGYHESFTTSKGNPCYYAVVPALDDACVTASCGGSSGCTLTLADSQLERITEVATHEFSELVSDPEPTANRAWGDSSGNEIGDVCGGVNGTIVVGGRSWKVQQEWDNQAGVCALGSVTVNPPPPTPPPPGKTKHSDVALVNILAYGFAWAKWKLRRT